MLSASGSVRRVAPEEDDVYARAWGCGVRGSGVHVEGTDDGTCDVRPASSPPTALSTCAVPRPLPSRRAAHSTRLINSNVPAETPGGGSAAGSAAGTSTAALTGADASLRKDSTMRRKQSARRSKSITELSTEELHIGQKLALIQFTAMMDRRRAVVPMHVKRNVRTALGNVLGLWSSERPKGRRCAGGWSPSALVRGGPGMGSVRVCVCVGGGTAFTERSWTHPHAALGVTAILAIATERHRRQGRIWIGPHRERATRRRSDARSRGPRAALLPRRV